MVKYRLAHARLNVFFNLTMFTRDDPLEDSSPGGGSDLMGGASGSSIGDGIGGSSLDVAEGSSIPDEDIVASDVSIGKDECMYCSDV